MADYALGSPRELRGRRQLAKAKIRNARGDAAYWRAEVRKIDAELAKRAKEGHRGD